MSFTIDDEDDFTELFEYFSNKKKQDEEILEAVCLKERVDRVLGLVNKRSLKKDLPQTSFDQIDFILKKTLSDVLQDLKAYSTTFQDKKLAPSATKSDLVLLKNTLDKVSEILSRSPHLENLINSSLKESTEPQLINPDQVTWKDGKFFDESVYGDFDTSLDLLREKSCKILKQIDALLSSDKSDSILESHLERHTQERRQLFKICFYHPNKLLLITTYHLEAMCSGLGIETKNGKAVIISLIASWLNEVILDNYLEYGSLSSVDKNTILELFRSKSWDLLLNK